MTEEPIDIDELLERLQRARNDIHNGDRVGWHPWGFAIDDAIEVIKEQRAMSGIHPAPSEFTPEEMSCFPILRFFHYAHLPPQLQARSKPFCDLARLIFDTTPNNAERTTAFRKLLEAKDCAVRAALP
jgi:hypothetical protein